MGLLTKILMIYLFLSIGALMYNPSAVLGNSKQADTVLSFFNINETNYQNFGSFNVSSEGSNANQGMLAPPVEKPNFLLLIDPVFQIFEWIKIIFKVITAPIQLLVYSAAPWQLQYILGLPLVFLLLIAIILIIRGLN